MLYKIKEIIHNPYKILSWSMSNIPSFGRLFSDEAFLKIKFRSVFGRKLDLEHPKSFNEKLQWLKLYDRKPVYTTMVDKYEVKKYVSDIIGEEYIIPTLGIWDHFEEIDFDALPNQFVLKCTHDSGGLVICRDKSTLDIAAARKKINKCLRKNFYWEGREWPYKNVKPRIIAEKYMEDCSTGGLRDYKIHSFHGVPKVILVCKDRYKDIGLSEDFFDTEWKHIDVKRPDHRNSVQTISRPEELNEMLVLTERLSQDCPFQRCDFYSVGGRVYFGELTFFPAGGLEKFEPDDFDFLMGEWIKLPVRGGVILHKNNMFLLVTQIENDKVIGLVDYKFFCFGGEPKLLYISKGLENHSTAEISFYDMHGKEMPFHRSDYKPFHNAEIPDSFEKMKIVAKTLCENVDSPFVRIDLYSINQHIYFSEITFTPCSGFLPFYPTSADIQIGELIQL